MTTQKHTPTPADIPPIGPTAPTLAQMDTAGQDIALAYYELGYLDGDVAGYERAQREEEAAWAWMRQHIRSIANSPTYAELARRRGQHHRADRAEQNLEDRGIGA